MKEHDKMKLWEDLSPEEKEVYHKRVDVLSKVSVLNGIKALYPGAKDSQELHNLMQQRVSDFEKLKENTSFLTRMREEINERQAKEYYYNNCNKEVIEVFYNEHFDTVVSETYFDSRIRQIIIKGEIKVGKDSLKLIEYVKEYRTQMYIDIVENYSWGYDWYQLDMPGVNEREILFQWFDVWSMITFDSFIRDLVMIKELDCYINELLYPSSERLLYNDCLSSNQKKNEREKREVKERIIKWIYECFASYIEELDIVLLKHALFKFLDGDRTTTGIKEISIKNNKLKSADLNSFIWVVWYYWSSIMPIKQEELIPFIKKVFRTAYKDSADKNYTIVGGDTIKAHLRDNTGKKIRIPKELITRKTK